MDQKDFFSQRYPSEVIKKLCLVRNPEHPSPVHVWRLLSHDNRWIDILRFKDFEKVTDPDKPGNPSITKWRAIVSGGKVYRLFPKTVFTALGVSVLTLWFNFAMKKQSDEYDVGTKILKAKDKAYSEGYKNGQNSVSGGENLSAHTVRKYIPLIRHLEQCKQQKEEKEQFKKDKINFAEMMKDLKNDLENHDGE